MPTPKPFPKLFPRVRTTTLGKSTNILQDNLHNNHIVFYCPNNNNLIAEPTTTTTTTTAPPPSTTTSNVIKLVKYPEPSLDTSLFGGK